MFRRNLARVRKARRRMRLVVRVHELNLIVLMNVNFDRIVS